MIDKLAELAEIQTSAIRDLEIDKVVVYDSGSGTGVGNFVQGLYGMMPQLNDFLEQSGMSLPEALVKREEAEKAAAATTTVTKVIEKPKPKAPTAKPESSEGES